MTTKLLKGALTHIAATAIAAVSFTPVAFAITSSGDMVNPVTGETETYVNTFTGGTEWNSADNWDTGNTPFISGNYDPALVSGDTVSTSTEIDGWTLRVGAYNGASITWAGGIRKIQGSTTGCWLTADKTSSITIASFAGNQLENNGNNVVFKLTSANAGGITWTTGLSSSSGYQNLQFQYYLGGNGTVVYGGDITVNNEQVIKMADVTLSGNAKSVQSKTLVTFGSGSTTAFTADATIKRFDSIGTDLDYDVHLATVTSGTTTLTTADAVGTCELVQTSTGIDLYWVDGDPDDMPPPTVYQTSININFTSGTALSTAADIGLGEYAVPGTAWNNLSVADNATLSALNVVTSSGTTWATAASVTITGTRGPWTCSSLTAASDLRQGYIDETASAPTPTVTVSGIPFDKYRVIVYTATDAEHVGFGYLTINGKNYTYVNGVLGEGTSAWGASGAKNTAEPIAEGTNVLVSPVILGSTLTVVGHRSGDNPRGCIAAIQIVEFVPEIGENDLVITVIGDKTYTVDEAKTLSGTVYVVGNGTLTLDGSAKITASTIDVSKDVVLNVNADRLDASTYAGVGTVVYDGTVPANTKGWNNSAVWAGTLWIKNTAIAGLVPADVANASSTVRLTGVTGYFNSNGNSTFSSDGTLDLQDDGNTKAFTVDNGWSANGITVFAKLTGSGTLTQSNHDIFQRYVFRDVSAFTGTIDIPEGTGDLGFSGNRPLRVIIGNSGTIPDTGKGTITIPSGSTTIAAGATWKAAGGILVNGVLTVADGMIMQSALTVASGGTLNVNTGKKLTLVKAYNLDGTVNVNGTLYSEDVNLTQTINGTVNVAGAFDAQGDVVIAPTGNITVSGKFWPNYGVRVKGNLSAPSLANIRSVSYVGNPEIIVDEGGVFTLTSTSNNKVSVDTNNADYEFEDYSRVKGSGTLKFSSTAGWRTFPSDDARMPATTLTIQAELADSLIITKDNNGETVIGNLAGSKNIRSDWTATNGGANARTLTVTQSKDTEWQGKFVSNRITQFNVGGTGGTLTLSGTQTENIPANITGSVNLTGTWVGPVTVAGTFGGTGTLTGDLTLSDGATIKVNDLSDLIDVSGSLTATGAITIELPEGANKGMLITTGGSSKPNISGATFTTKVGGVVKNNLKITATAGGLKVGAQSLLIRIR